MEANDALKMLMDAVSGHQWLAAGAFAVFLLTLVLRWLAGSWSKLNWLKTDRGGVLLTWIGGTVVALGSALIAGQQVSVGLVVTGIEAGVLAAGGFNQVKRLLFPKE